jgi:hypothetical protein
MTKRPAEDILRELANYFVVKSHGEPRGPYGTLGAFFLPSKAHEFCFAWARNSYDEAALAHLAKLINEARETVGMERVEVSPRAEPILCLDDGQTGIKM